MSMSIPPLEGFERVIEVVRSHGHGRALSVLCFDVLSSQAEKKSLQAGRRFIRARAVALGLTVVEADTALGNVKAILERGPERSAEWMLICAFAIRGLDERMADADATEKRDLLERFVKQADWLELTTTYTPYRFVPVLLRDEHQDGLIEALEGALLAPVDPVQLAAQRARSMVRMHVLSQLSRPAARVTFARVAEITQDSWVKALAREALGSEPVPGTDGFELRGAWGTVPRLTVGRVLAYFTGATLVMGVLRVIGWGLGLTRQARVKLEAGALHVQRETRLFGRVIRVRDASYALREVDTATREVSMPAFQVLIGALALGTSVVLAMFWFSGAMARGDSTLMRSAGLAVVAGVALDLLFTGWGRLRAERAGFELFVDQRRVVTLRKVDPERAQRLVEQIARRRSV
jgi:hypothetical protein